MSEHIPSHRALQAASLANWRRVPPHQRTLCIEHLRSFVPEHIQARWKRQLATGEPIGGPGFHTLGGGMSVRNRLREILLDGDLPAVVQPDGADARNWDDFYMGAIQEMLETEPA